MPDLTPQQQGRLYEEEMAKKINGKPVPMSGAGFTKLDVFGFKILWSLKHTIKKSFRVDDDLFQEVRDAIYSPGGVGPEYLGAIAVKTANHEVAAMKLDDFMLMAHRLRELTEENEILRNLKKDQGLTEREIDAAVEREQYDAEQTGRPVSFPSRKLPSGRKLGR